MRRTGARLSAALLSVVGLATGTAGCGGDGSQAANSAVIDVPADRVSTVTFTAGARFSTFRGEGGTFQPVEGATQEFAAQLGLVAERLFPLNAYRSLPEADPADPAYALEPVGASPGRRAQECGAGCSMTVSSASGVTARVLIGGRSFNDAGFYAAVEGRPGVHLLIAKTVSDIISFSTGRPFDFPPTARAAGVDKAIDELAADGGGKDPDANRHPFLRQKLAAEADRRASAAGRPGGNLVRTATSTQGQAGARPGPGAPPSQSPSQSPPAPIGSDG